MYLLYIIPKVCVLQRTCDAGYFQHKIIIFCSVLVHFYGNGCNSMAPNGIETHHYHTTAPVDCQIQFLSFERLPSRRTSACGRIRRGTPRGRHTAHSIRSVPPRTRPWRRRAPPPSCPSVDCCLIPASVTARHCRAPRPPPTCSPRRRGPLPSARPLPARW